MTVSGTEIIFDHGLNCARANVGRDVAILQFAENLMDENTIRDLQSDLCQVLMAAVHRISGLKSRDLRPAPFEKHGPRLGRADIEVGIFGRIFALAQRHDASGQIDIPLGEQLRYARMLRISGAIDVLGLQLFVD